MNLAFYLTFWVACLAFALGLLDDIFNFAWTRLATVWESRRRDRLSPPEPVATPFMDAVEFDWPSR